MLTFSLNDVDGSDSHAVLVWETIRNNLGYFKKFNHDRWEEAVHKTYITALEHRNSTYGDNILPYIKKLARTILQVKMKESSYGVFTDEGEISPTFAVLKGYIDTDSIDGSDELKDVYKELYLLDSESFMKLKSLFIYNDEKELRKLKDLRIKNQRLNTELRNLVSKYGADFTFRVLYEFFEELPKLKAVRQTGLTKEVVIKKGNLGVLDKIPDTPLIVDSNGDYHYIDKTTLTMRNNPDFFKWDLIGSSLCDILRVDISPFMEYMYEQVFVDMGVNTRHITWCGDKYSLTTPSGEVYLGLEKDKFISVVRIELILNLMMNNVGAVIAISPDNIYIKPTRAFKFDKIRTKSVQGKIIDLPIDIHIKKRK